MTHDINPLVLIPQYFGSLVFDRRNSRYAPFDQTTTELFKQSVNSPITSALNHVENEEQRDILEDFIDYFYRQGYFTEEYLFAGKALDITPPTDHLTGPLAVHLEISAACNLTCTHCFAGELPRKEDALTQKELDKLFSELSQIGSFRLGLTGGEPLLRKDLLDIVDSALENGLHPCLTTNALLLTEELAKALGKRDLLWLNVSLDGATAKTHDLIRGIGSFDKTIKKIQLLSRYSRFTLAFTVLSTNTHEIDQCAELAAQLGAHTAVFRPLYPVGQAKENLDLMPTFTQYSKALSSLESFGDKVVSKRVELRAVDPFSPTRRTPSKSKIYENLGCGAGNTVCSISLGGEVNPCSFLGSDYVAGTIRNESFENIWHRSEVLRTMREKTSADFSGGCRARSLILAGGIDKADPWVTEFGTESPSVDIDRSNRKPFNSPDHPMQIIRIEALTQKVHHARNH